MTAPTPTPTPRTDGLPRPSHFTSGDLAAWVDAAQKRISQLERELAEAQRKRDAWRECADRLDVELYDLALLADHLMRRPESQHDVEAELEGANNAIAAYNKLKEESK